MRALGKADRIALRKWRSLQWRDPCADLVALGLLQGDLTRQGLDPKHDDLRARELRQYLEQKQAALFSYFCSHAILKDRVEYAMFENEDYESKPSLLSSASMSPPGKPSSLCMLTRRVS